MKVIKFKNNKQSADTWLGETIQPGQYWQLQSQLDWDQSINNTKVNQDLWSGDLIINDGVSDLSAAEGDAYLKDTTVKEVVTQFEKNDKTLKMSSGKGSVDGTSVAEVIILVPGNPANGDGRWIDAGTSWFDAIHEDDRITNVEVVDIDNILGYGAGFVVKTYHDDEVAASSAGWYIPKHTGVSKVEALGGYGFIPAGLYLRVKGLKGGGATTGSLYLNIKWGKID